MGGETKVWERVRVDVRGSFEGVLVCLRYDNLIDRLFVK